MKKVFCLVMFFVLVFVGFGFSADKSVTVGWQDGNSSGTVASWDVFTGTSATGPWTLGKNQPYYDKGAAAEYQTTFTISVPDNAVTTIFFKANGIGTNGLRSVDSNIASKAYDTRTEPIAPTNFNVK